MKKVALSVCLVTGLFVLTLFTASAGTVKQERQVKSFEGISLALSADVKLTQGAGTKVVLEGPADYLEKVETVTEGGILKIRFYQKYTGWRTPSGRIRISITTPEINSLTVTGSGKIESVTPVHAGDMLKALVTGSGVIKIGDLTAGEVKMSVTGSGDIRISGKETGQAYVVITGSGDIHAGGLPARTVKVSITGSGDAYVNASEDLKVGITGSGDVYFRGEAVVDAHITGSGDLKRMNDVATG